MITSRLRIEFENVNFIHGIFGNISGLESRNLHFNWQLEKCSFSRWIWKSDQKKMLKRSPCSNIEPSTWIQQLIHTKGNRGVAKAAQHNSRQVQVYVSNENIFGLLWRRRWRWQRCIVSPAYGSVCAQYWCKWFCALLRSSICVHYSRSLCFPGNPIRDPAVKTTFGASFRITVSRVIFRCCCLLNSSAMNFVFISSCE